MSGLETLPPDQRAVLQLILVQGRGYADLATLLKLDPDAVRSRAHAGVEALGVPGGDALDAAQRARVADYLLGQQDDGERIVTFAELGDSAGACRWAQSLRERLAPIASEELPEVPATASANGSAPKPAAAAPPAPPPASTPSGVAGLPAPGPSPAATPAPAKAPRPSGPRSSRLGGAALLAGVAALAVVLAIVLIGGGDDDAGSPSTTSAQTQTQTSPRTQPSTTPTTPTARLIGQVNLTAAPGAGDALGIGLVQRSGRRLAIAIEARRLPANGAQDIYAVWLEGATGNRFLGFVPRQVRAGGTFTVSAALPSNVRDYSTVLVTREGITEVPRAPGETVLSGAIRLRA